MMTLEEIHRGLQEQGYHSNSSIEYSLLESMILKKPILIEGDPGVGKTSLAIAVSNMLGIPLVRLQMYDGLTDDRVLYDYDYQRQLLTLEALKPKIDEMTAKDNINDSIRKIATEVDFYGKEFLIPRPVLRTIDGTGKKLFLIDEIDKASEETEYMLYEYLENYSITIPQYGKIECPEDQHPIVMLTSNGYRELSGAMRRRCSFLYIEKKTYQEIIEILKLRTNVNDELAHGISSCIIALQNTSLRHPVSISEAIDWAKFIEACPSKKEAAINALGLLVKDKKDMDVAKEVILKSWQKNLL